MSKILFRQHFKAGRRIRRQDQSSKKLDTTIYPLRRDLTHCFVFGSTSTMNNNCKRQRRNDSGSCGCGLGCSSRTVALKSAIAAINFDAAVPVPASSSPNTCCFRRHKCYYFKHVTALSQRRTRGPKEPARRIGRRRNSPTRTSAIPAAPKTMATDQSVRRSEIRRIGGYGSVRVVAGGGYIRPRAVLCVLLGSVLFLPNISRFAHGQYKTGTALYEEKMAEAEVELTETLQGGEYVEDTFYPDRQVSALVDPQSTNEHQSAALL